MNRDFDDFNTIDPIEPPQVLTESILSRVHQDLSPSAWKVFSKLSLIHLVTAVGTLAFCPQFGWSLWGERVGSLGIWMSLTMLMGSYGCTVACGSLFLGSSLFVASLILRPEELRVIRRNRALGLSALAFLSLGFFLMLGTTSIVFGFALAWLAGSLLGGVLSLELGWALRFKLLN